mgnify:FL=1
MSSITYPNNISNADTPDWDLVKAYFDAVNTRATTTKLDNNNIANAAAIAYSKLALSNSIATGDLAAQAVTYPKIATPTVTTVTSSAVADGGMVISTPKQTLSQAAPSTAFYLIVVQAEAFNTYHSTSSAATLTSTLKIGGAANQIKHRDWWINAAAGAPDLYASIDHIVPASLTSGDVVSHEFTDSGSSHTQVTAGGVRLYLVRLAA